MSFLKTGLIFGLIKKIIVSIFKAVYAILSIFNLHLTLFIGLIGLVLFLTGVFDEYPSVKTGFDIAIIVSIIIAIVVTVRKLLGLSDKKRKKNGVEIMPADEADASAVERDKNEDVVIKDERSPRREQFATEDSEKPAQYPVYYEVKQNRNYVMAEYADRYELYFRDRNGLIKIRTDMKTEREW